MRQNHLQREVQPLDHAAQRRVRQLDVQGNHWTILATRLTVTEPSLAPRCRHRVGVRHCLRFGGLSTKFLYSQRLQPIAIELACAVARHVAGKQVVGG